MSAAPFESKTILELARAIAARGWRPFPVDHPSLPTCAGTTTRCRRNREKFGDCPRGKRGKHPVGGWGTMSASEPTEAMLALWFGNEPRNIAIACGPSGLLVLDEDVPGSLEKLARQLGEEVPPTYRVRTGRAKHWYFDDPTNEFGNSPGGLADWDIDVRGGRGDGGYVLASGSTHWSGCAYEADDPYVAPAPLPDWIKKVIRSPAKKVPGGAQTDEERSGEWDDRPRYGTAETLRAQYERHVADVRALATTTDRRPNGGVFRHALYLAALDGWRLVDCGLIDEISMLHQIRAAVRLVWAADPDDDDRTIVYEEARDKASTSPWVVVEHTEEQIPDPYERAKATELTRERIRREVRAVLDAEGREPLRVLDADEFLDAPSPEYLVPKMFYKDGLAVVFGAPGAAKSFWVLDIALCLATRVQWRGRDLGRAKVHYIMAEGQATNTLRTKAWLAHHKVDRAELKQWWKVIPSAILLTDAGIVDYLPVVAADKPDMIVLDTKNLMFAGKESQGDDYGAMLRVLHHIREIAGGASIVLIDHSGLFDDGRTRGSNAQKGGVETEIRVTEETGFRRVEVTRDKSGAVGAQWLFKLVQVPGVLTPADVDPPAVCVAMEPEEVTTSALFDDERAEDWNDPTQVELPEDVVTYSGVGADAIKAVARFMRHSATGVIGFNRVQAVRNVRLVYLDEKGKPKHTEKTVQRAWDALVELKRLAPSGKGGPTSSSLWVTRPKDPS